MASSVLLTSSRSYRCGTLRRAPKSKVVSQVISFPACMREALVHLRRRGLRRNLKFLWHLERQNRRARPVKAANVSTYLHTRIARIAGGPTVISDEGNTLRGICWAATKVARIDPGLVRYCHHDLENSVETNLMVSFVMLIVLWCAS